MKIRNTTTGQIDELIYAREPHNTGNIVDDPAIVYNQETDESEANQETIDWWTEYLKNESDYQDLYAEARAGLDPVAHDELDNELISVVSGCEYGDAPVAGIAYLKKFISEQRFANTMKTGNKVRMTAENSNWVIGETGTITEILEGEGKVVIEFAGREDDYTAFVGDFEILGDTH